jgi:hypothetical protein
MRNIHRVLIILMGLSVGADLAHAQARGRPMPPGNLCVDPDPVTGCPPAPATVASGAKIKWNPGHYVRADEQGWTAKRPNRFAVYETIRSVPQVKGAAFVVNWGMVENQRGVYDWSGVDAEIKQLASMNKKAIIDLWYLGFGGTLPKVPQGKDYRYIGDYLITEGCAGSVSYGGYGARLDIPACMDRWIEFIKAVAVRYDGNPTVESIHIGENSTNMVGQSLAGLARQWQRIPAVLKASFKQTHTVIHNNYFLSVAETQALSNLMVENGVGSGGPDIYVTFKVPQDPNKDAWGALAMRGAGAVPGLGTFGTRDSRSVVPQSYEAQVVRPVELTPAVVNDHANTYLKSNHTVWTAYYGYNPRQYGGTVEIPAFRWEGAAGLLEFLKKPSSAVRNIACPGAFVGRCQ